MRSSRDGKHVSGAERIVGETAVARTASALAQRAFRLDPDFVNIKVERLGSVKRLPALHVAEENVATAEGGWERAEHILAAAGFSRTKEIRRLFAETYPMRGAMLLDADSLERLEPDRERGVRATCMDSSPSPSAAVKNHYSEALALATKVLSAPGIVGEVCVSDDPGYVTGYVAVGGVYHRIAVMKERGAALGGRIFLYRGRREDAAKTVSYLESEPVVVEGLAPQPPTHRAAGRNAVIAAELDALRDAGLLRRAPTPRPPSPPQTGDAFLADFSTNDYLGLSQDSRVREAAVRAAYDYGGGSAASRLVSGTLEIHRSLERALADFKRTDDAILFSTGYMANLGVVSALAGRGDIVLSDELNHASIIDGCRLGGAEVQVYRHLDMDDLERRLSFCSAFRRRLVVSDGVFSMDGDMLDLPRFVEICRRYDAFSMVDEAHSIGVIGRTGRGLAELHGVLDSPEAKPDLMMGTLSKALGSQGGYVAASRLLVEFLRQRARPYMFSTAPCPAAAAAALTALAILEEEPWRVAELTAKTAMFRRLLAASESSVAADAEIPAPGSLTAIVPIPIGGEKAALDASAALALQGFRIPAIRYPTVPLGAARLRAAVSAPISTDAIVAAAAAIRRLPPAD